MPEKIILLKPEVYNYIAEFTLLAFIRVDFGILCKPAFRPHITHGPDYLDMANKKISKQTNKNKR
jgi:hypothetical protein